MLFQLAHAAIEARSQADMEKVLVQLASLQTDCVQLTVQLRAEQENSEAEMGKVLVQLASLQTDCAQLTHKLQTEQSSSQQQVTSSIF